MSVVQQVTLANPVSKIEVLLAKLNLIGKVTLCPAPVLGLLV